MISGFDYGTSNCALGLMQSGQAQLVNIDGSHAFMPSTVYALGRELISEWLAAQLVGQAQQSFISAREQDLTQAKRFRREAFIEDDEQTLFFGRAAFDEYLAMPEEGYFVKSPKSFLGASGLQAKTLNFFEDIVASMMLTIKRSAEAGLSEPITHTVIGRPVNFQGVNSDESNRQALAILRAAAKRAGFKEVEFLYEPLAAGLHFEQQLEKEQLVLVVDIGGGTTDCSMVKMGPKLKDKVDRSDDFLGHSGERIGGNDLDIHLASHAFMPLFGMHSFKKSGLQMPTQIYWNAVSTNDLSAQSDFLHRDTGLLLEQLQRDAKQPELIARMIKLREQKQNHALVRSAERSKIALSDAEVFVADLAALDEGLELAVNRSAFQQAITRPLGRMIALMHEAIKQAACKPELIYITGGSAKSPMLTQAIQQSIGDIPVLDGDHFGSVATGLTLWANRIYA